MGKPVFNLSLPRYSGQDKAGPGKVDQGILRAPKRKTYGLRHLRRMSTVMRQKIDQTFGPRAHPEKRPQLKTEVAVRCNRHLPRQYGVT